MNPFNLDHANAEIQRRLQAAQSRKLASDVRSRTGRGWRTRHLAQSRSGHLS